MLLGALRSALSAKVADQKLTVLDNLAMPAVKTREFAETLMRFEIVRSLLVVDMAEDHNLKLSSRNVKNVSLVLRRPIIIPNTRAKPF
jgi:large subunit ribosomal protein L4